MRRRRVDRGARPAHQPRRRPDAQPAGAELRGVRRRPRRDGRRGEFPGARRADRSAARGPARRATGWCGSTPRAGSPTRAPTRCPRFHRLGVRRRPRRALPGRGHRRAARRSTAPVDESLPLVLVGPRAVAQSTSRPRGATLSLRAIPLTERGERDRRAACCAATCPSCAGASASCITKDATIREIHHRVKNNLQTVAALLRLQARRIALRRRRGRRCGRRCGGWRRSRSCTRPCPRGSARASTSTTWSTARCALAVEVAATEGARVRTRRERRVRRDAGRGRDPARAGPHRARDERRRARARRARRGPSRSSPTVRTDAAAGDGRGRRLRACPTEFAPGHGLGTQIVQALVGGELRGRIGGPSAPEGGNAGHRRCHPARQRGVRSPECGGDGGAT